MKTNNKNSYKTVAPTPFSYNGFLAKNHHIKRDVFLKEISRKIKKRLPKDTLWNSDLKNLMNEIILTSRIKGTEILLINSLKLHKQVFSDSYIDSLTKANANVKFLNFNSKRDSYFLNEKDFYNSTHLNYPGSVKVTERLVDSLSSFYSLSLLEKNEWNFRYFKLKDLFYSLDERQDKFIKIEFDKLPKFLKDYQLVISLYSKDKSLLSDYSKKKQLGSDNFYVKDFVKNNFDTGKSKIIVKRLDTKINEKNLKRIAIYFYKPKDTLSMGTFNIFKN